MQQSNSSKDLWLLEGLDDFRQESVKLLHQTRRSLAILSYDLDAQVYAENDFIESISAFARSSSGAIIQILIKDTQPAIAIGHPLIRLAQRLSSKILVRKITIEPNNKDMAYIISDTQGLLYKNDDKIYQGFVNYSAAIEIKTLREEFNYVWQYAEAEPEFRLLSL
jgi:hypothetical protein